jgi:hypothetical protein
VTNIARLSISAVLATMVRAKVKVRVKVRVRVRVKVSLGIGFNPIPSLTIPTHI